MAQDLYSNLPPEIVLQQQGLNRQQEMAKALLAQGAQQNANPSGQMVSGRYVPNSFFQNLQGPVNQMLGAYLAKQGDTKATELAKQLREGRNAAEEKILQQMTGYDKTTELAGPYAGNVPQPTAVQRIEPNLPNALREIRTNPYGAGKEYTPTILKQMMPEATTLEKEWKAAQTQGYTGNINDFKNQMNEYQKIQAVNDKQRLGYEGQRIGLEGQRLNLEKQKAAQELMFGKPLPEGALKQVTGATNLKDAIENYKTELKDFSTIDFANPNARAKIGNSYNNMMLQAKEAYNLGVLNGPDYQILQSVVKDPTSPGALLVSKKTLEKQANDLSKQADVIVGNVYKTHNKPVPTGLGAPPPPSQGQPAPQIDPKLLQYMTPDQRKLFGG